MPTIIPSTSWPSLTQDLIRLLVANCLRSGSVANFVEGMASTGPETGKIHLFPDFLPVAPDFAGAVMAQQDLTEDSEPVRTATVNVVLRCAQATEDGTAGGTAWGAKMWAMQAADCVAQFTRPGNTGNIRTQDTLSSGRRILGYTPARIMPAGEDDAKRYLVAVEFKITFTDLNVS
jgi:hypothetical protein